MTENESLELTGWQYETRHPHESGKEVLFKEDIADGPKLI